MNNTAYRLSLRNLWYCLATGFGSGRSPFFPGTAGSLAALPCWLLLIQLPTPFYGLSVTFGIITGCWLCHFVAKDMQEADPASIVWDEFVGLWIALMALPANNALWVISGFILFRLLDIWKPWPIRWCDRHIKGGIGIMFDDIVAGLICAGILHLAGILSQSA